MKLKEATFSPACCFLSVHNQDNSKSKKYPPQHTLLYTEILEYRDSNLNVFALHHTYYDVFIHEASQYMYPALIML